MTAPITRRQALAGIGAVGGLALAPRAVRAARGDPPFTRYTLAQSSGGPDLRIAWYETYNGVYQEDSDRLTDGPGLAPTAAAFNDSATAGRFVDGVEGVVAGAVVDLGDVLPGDEGVVVVGLLAADADATVWLRVRLDATPENGRVEPERAAGDDTDATGELQDALGVELWYDNGVLGGCNGVRDASESLVTGLSELGGVDGSLAAVAAQTAGGVELDFGLLDSGCLPAGVERCLGVRWSLDESVGNAVQTDGVSFALEFAAVPCGDDTNPVTGATGGSA